MIHIINKYIKIILSKKINIDIQKLQIKINNNKKNLIKFLYFTTFY
jgi:hypothetical protein